MKNNIPKISVLIICYKQEKLIRRALDSLINQREYIYEICVSDDQSPDGTWNILKEYEKKYPGLFRLNRNNPNVGIFENIEKVWSMSTGDLNYMLAGDDECGPKYFKHIIEFIKTNKIDYQNESFCIYGDYIQRYPDGHEILYSNKLITQYDALKLKIRKLLSCRSAIFSKKVMDRFEKVSEGRAYNTEMLQDALMQIYSNNNYYIPCVGNIYYASIGVSTSMNGNERLKGLYEGPRRLVSYAESHEKKIDRSDKYFLRFVIAYNTKQWLMALYYYLLSIDISLGKYGFQIDKILTILKRRSRS